MKVHARIMTTLAAATMALASGLHAQSREELTQLLSDSMAQWKAIPVESELHHDAPASWKAVSMEPFGVSASFPCSPKRQESESKGRQIVMLVCQEDGIAYELSYSPDQVRNASPMGLEASLLGVEYGSRESMRKQNGPATSIRKKQVIYAGAMGRDTRITAGAREMTMRILVHGPDLVQLLVVGPTGSTDKPSNVFFSSLSSASN